MATLTTTSPPALTVTPGSDVTLSATPGPATFPPIPDHALRKPVSLVRDFCFASLDGSLDGSSTSILVDDVTALPTNAELAKAPLWLTIESDLVHPATFEIVKLTSVDTDTNTLTVLRGQLGTVAQSHDDATLIKGALSAEMIRRYRGAFLADRAPQPDADIYSVGDRLAVLAQGLTYRFEGGARYSTYHFDGLNGGSTLGSDYLPDIAGQQANTSLPWTAALGTFGNPSSDDGRPTYAAIVKSVDPDTSTACALYNQGSRRFQVDFYMNTGSSDTVDAGFMFGATPDARNGWYISLLPGTAPTVYRVVNGIFTSLGTVGTDAVATSDAVFVSIWCYDEVIRIWFQSSANAAFAYSEFADFDTDDDPCGSNNGFFANSADCASDTDLRWNEIDSYFGIGEGVARGTGLYVTIENLDDTGTLVDTPTAVEIRHANQGAEPWIGAVGTWGIVTNGEISAQQASYASDSVDGTALLATDLHARDFDIAFVLHRAANSLSVYGMWLRGSMDGQDGLFLQIDQSYSNQVRLYAVAGGVVDTNNPLISSSSPFQVVDNLIRLRVVAFGNTLVVFDQLNSVGVSFPTELGRCTLPTLYRDFGGTGFGLRLSGDEALADADLGLVSLQINDMTPPFDWTPEPSYRSAYGPPVLPMPPGSLYFDQGAEVLYAALSSTPYWMTIGLQTGSGAPSSSAVAPALYIDDENFALYYWGFDGQWHSIGTGGGGGGGGDGSMRGLANMGFYGTISDPLQVGDFIEGGGGLLREVLPDSAGQYQTDSPALNAWPTFDTTNSDWIAVGDASFDLIDGGLAKLTLSDTASDGMVVNPHAIAIDDFHVSFRLDNSNEGGGFTFGFFTDADVIASDDTSPVFAHWAGAALEFGNSNGAGSNNGFFLVFDNDSDIAYVGSGSYSNFSSAGSFSITAGSHTWDIRFEKDVNQRPGCYNIVIYCDGDPVYADYQSAFNVVNGAEAGYVFFSAETPATGGPVEVVVDEFVVYQAQQYFRTRTDFLKETVVPFQYLNGWAHHTTTPGWSISGDRVQLHGQIIGGDANEPICIMELSMNPQEETLVPVVIVGDSPRIDILQIANSGLLITNYTAGEIVYLDSVSYPRHP